MYNREVADALRRLILEKGNDVYADRDRFRGLLLDYARGSRSEVDLIMMCLDADLVEILRPSGTMSELNILKAQRQLKQKKHITDEAANFSVTAWFSALTGIRGPQYVASAPGTVSAKTNNTEADKPLTINQLTTKPPEIKKTTPKAGHTAATMPAKAEARMRIQHVKAAKPVEIPDASLPETPDQSEKIPFSARIMAQVRRKTLGEPVKTPIRASKSRPPEMPPYIEVWWDEIYNFHEGRAIVVCDGKEGFVDKMGNVVLHPEWDGVSNYVSGIAIIERDGKSGYVDHEGLVISRPQWDRAYNFKEGLGHVVKNGKHNFLDMRGKPISWHTWDYAFDFNNGFSKVIKDGLCGFIDKRGKPVSKPQWDDAEFFQATGFAVIVKDGKKGVIDTEGRLIIPPLWGSISPFTNGLARVSRNGIISMIDTQGRVTEVDA